MTTNQAIRRYWDYIRWETWASSTRKQAVPNGVWVAPVISLRWLPLRTWFREAAGVGLREKAEPRRQDQHRFLPLLEIGAGPEVFVFQQ